MEPERTFMKKAKIELFSNCFAGLTKQNELKNYFTANHSKTSKCAHLVETGGGGGGHVMSLVLNWPSLAFMQPLGLF